MTTTQTPTRTPDQPADDVLARRAAGGHPEAFAELVSRYERRLYNFLLRHQRREVDAEDLTQDTFARAWERIDSYNPAFAFSTWLFTIAARLSMNLTRNRIRRPAGAILTDPEGPTPDPRRTAESREQHASIWTAAERVLTDEQRSALWLRYVEQLGIADVASILDKNAVAVRVMLHRARARLAEELESPARSAEPSPPASLSLCARRSGFAERTAGSLT